MIQTQTSTVRELNQDKVSFASDYAKDALRAWCMREGLSFEELIRIVEKDEETLYVEAFFFVRGVPALNATGCDWVKVSFQLRVSSLPPFDLFE